MSSRKPRGSALIRPRSARTFTGRPKRAKPAVPPSATPSSAPVTATPRSRSAPQPPAADRDLEAIRRLVDAPLAARLELEVLDGIGDVDGGSIHALFRQ